MDEIGNAFTQRYRPAGTDRRRRLSAIKRLLAPEDTLEDAYRPAFEAYSRVARELWQPTVEIRAHGTCPSPTSRVLA